MVEKINNFAVDANAKVQFKDCGNIAEIKYVRHRNSSRKFKKLNADEYVVIGSGEVRNFKRYEDRSEDFQSIRESMERLRDYINTNVTDLNKCRFLTLTYAENMRDTKQIYQDFKSFNRACREKYGDYEYIAAVEPQKRGSFHYHVILIFPQKAPFMENKEVAEIWGKGFVNIRKLNPDISNIGLYLTAYLCDIAVDDVEYVPAGIKSNRLKIIEAGENGEKKSKAVIKGGRLSLYPRGCHFYRISKGIKKPEIKVMTNKKAMQKVKNFTLTYNVTYQVTDDNSGSINIINKRCYSRLRRKYIEF